MISNTELSMVKVKSYLNLLILLLMTTFLADNLKAQDWELVHNLPGYTIRDVAVSPNGDIFVAVDTDGVLRSVDDGATWQPKNTDLDLASNYRLAVDPDGRLLAASEDTIYRSLDNGETWTVVHAFFKTPCCPSTYVENGTDIRYTEQGTVVAGYWDITESVIGDFWGGGSIWSNDSGSTFTASTCEDSDYGWCSGPTHTIANGFGGVVFRGGTEEIYFGGSPESLYDSKISRSFDGGLTWTNRSEGLGAGFVTGIAVSYDGPIVAGIYDGQLYRSTDLGDSWTLTEGIPSVTAVEALVSRLDELYVATPYELYRSLDGGLNWIEFSDGLPTDVVLSGLEIDYQGTIWAMTDQGLYRTTCPGLDSDGDGYVDCIDRCAGSDDALDQDMDGIPDGCDNCVATSNFFQTDINSNGVGDICEGCCGFWAGGYTGNTNCSEDGVRSLADISRLIDHVFISKEPLCCEGNGNTNGSEDGQITLSDITRLIDNVYISKAETASCE